MSRSEYIIWRCECREMLRKDHPTDSDKLIEMRLDAIERAIKKLHPDFFEGIEEVK